MAKNKTETERKEIELKDTATIEYIPHIPCYDAWGFCGWLELPKCKRKVKSMWIECKKGAEDDNIDPQKER